ncbi:hypothetical protein CDD81_7611 [Ophiocordyceps australis]|uniref:Kinetochore protein mis14 n=1 Tax=Ophiocordyceps australis TaxID=1399860 RepID=A0A2C5XXS2_9HYPO|nr:hypothetical protein CDD81_7611 [Ophiocordyceps australis]
MDPDTESVVSHVQRKIELQSPEDLAFLVANVRRAATARLDEAFPPTASSQTGGDEMREQISKLVDEYITRTFSLAAPNLSINGLALPADAMQPQPAYEPFDARKRTRLAELVATEERLLQDVAQLKRSVPPAIAQAAAARAQAADEADEASLARRLHALPAAEAARDDEAPPLLSDLPRQQAVEQAFGAAVRGLENLKRDIPAVIAKMERARVAGEYVVGHAE